MIFLRIMKSLEARLRGRLEGKASSKWRCGESDIFREVTFRKFGADGKRPLAFICSRVDVHPVSGSLSSGKVAGMWVPGVAGRHFMSGVGSQTADHRRNFDRAQLKGKTNNLSEGVSNHHSGIDQYQEPCSSLQENSYSILTYWRWHHCIITTIIFAPLVLQVIKRIELKYTDYLSLH